MSEQQIVTAHCEICGGKVSNKFSALELKTWEAQITKEKEKDFYDVCYTCFDKLTEAPLLTEEVKNNRKINSIHLEKAIRDGLACPKCKNIIFDEHHICPS
jgi:hypothetical protein